MQVKQEVHKHWHRGENWRLFLVGYLVSIIQSETERKGAPKM